MKVLTKPRPSEKRLKRYWKNWMHNVWRTPVNTEWTATCFVCDKKGVLGTDLIYRGESRPRNLTCNSCNKKGKTWQSARQ